MLVMPKAEYRTWGERFEGRGVKPDVRVPWLPHEGFGSPADQLSRAIETI